MPHNGTYSHLFADSARGIYIPQHFAESHNPDKWKYLDPADMDILRAGPDHPDYWDAWSDVMDKAETVDGGVLHQDGDLWVIYADAARDAINTFCADQLEYEESHRDAGDAYSHMPRESWCKESEARLQEELARHEIDTQGLDIDALSDMALDLFEMRSGHIFGPYRDGIIIDAYPVQEIEIGLDSCGVDGIALDYVRESCEPYITGTDRAYLTTDAVWYAVVDPAAMRDAIAEKAAAC
jgi:hypothetical protein